MKITIIAVISLLCQLSTNAAVYAYGSATGTVTGITEEGIGDAPDSVSIGSTCSITFSYNTEAIAIPGSVTSTNTAYGTAIDLQIAINIDGHQFRASTFTPAGVSAVSIKNNDPTDQFNLLSGEFNSGSTIIPNKLTFGNIILNFYDLTPSYNFTNGLTLPQSHSELLLSEITNSTGNVGTDDTSGNLYRIDFDIDPLSLEISNVPEPSSALLIGFGCLILFSRRSRHKYRTRCCAEKST